jgi:prenyltransferase beta subunit
MHSSTAGTAPNRPQFHPDLCHTMYCLLLLLLLLFDAQIRIKNRH